MKPLLIAFSLLRLSGDLAAELAGDDATEAEIAAVAKAYGLDRPLYVQYLDWAGHAISGDVGQSIFSNEPVWEILTGAVPTTAKLAVLALTHLTKASGASPLYRAMGSLALVAASRAVWTSRPPQ